VQKGTNEGEDAVDVERTLLARDVRVGGGGALEGGARI
jgi:hypothetical protein